MRNPAKLQLLFSLFLCTSCAKISGQIQQALSTITTCESKVEYQFVLPSTVSNPLSNFTASAVGGSATVLSDGCSKIAEGSVSSLPPEHAVTRTTNDLTITVAASTVMALKITSGQLSGSIPDTCRKGNRVIHTLEGGEVMANQTPKVIRLTVKSRVVLAGCQ
jgi:hypothetical protein